MQHEGSDEMAVLDALAHGGVADLHGLVARTCRRPARIRDALVRLEAEGSVLELAAGIFFRSRGAFANLVPRVVGVDQRCARHGRGEAGLSA